MAEGSKENSEFRATTADRAKMSFEDFIYFIQCECTANKISRSSKVLFIIFLFTRSQKSLIWCDKL